MERNEPLVAWNGRPEITIDRYDVRSLLDMIPDTKLPALPMTEEEAEVRVALDAARSLLTPSSKRSSSTLSAITW